MTIEELLARIEVLEKALADLKERMENDQDAQDDRFSRVQLRHERQMQRLGEQIAEVR